MDNTLHVLKHVLKAAEARGVTKLDAEVLLSHCLQCSRTSLYAWPEKVVSEKDQYCFEALIERRLQGEPLAYLIGEKEFWSLPFTVTPDVLIPRPETELIVELSLKLFEKMNRPVRVLELGTGSGAISIALASERPDWSIVATDISFKALEIARLNAKKFSLSNIQFYQGDWFLALSELKPSQKLFDLIVSNPPYIPDNDPHLEAADLKREPSLALRGGVFGLRDLEKIIKEAKKFLAPKAWLILEHGFDQSEEICLLFQRFSYFSVETKKDLAGVKRVTTGQKK